MIDGQAAPPSVDESESLREQLQETLARLGSGQTSQMDSIRLRRVESLLQRSRSKNPQVEKQLLGRAKQLLHDFDFDSTEQASETHKANLDKAGPDRADSPLADLLNVLARRNALKFADIEPQTFEGQLRKQEVDALREADDIVAVAELDSLSPEGELQLLQEIRQAWAKRSTEKAVEKALKEAPEDAGPLNAHGLVVRSLLEMQELSPEYLGRFVNQIESLLWLEQAGNRLLEKAKPSPKSANKRRR